MVNRRFGALFAFVAALVTQTYSECIDPQVVRELASAMYELQRVSSQPPMELPASTMDEDHDSMDHSNVRMRAMPVGAVVDESSHIPPSDARMQSPSARQTMINMKMLRSMPLANAVNPPTLRTKPMDELRMMMMVANENRDQVSRSRMRNARMRSLPVDDIRMMMAMKDEHDRLLRSRMRQSRVNDGEERMRSM